ncbi:K(+)-transporting ATPase subunit C [soil metagenome]
MKTNIEQQNDEATPSLLGHLWASVAATAILTVIVSGIYPVLVWGIAQLAFPNQANGSLVKKDGSYTTKDEEAVGSSLLGQNFSAPQYFHPRPSAAGAGYDATSSGGTNLGPLSDKLINGVADDPATKDVDESFAGVKQLVAAYRTENGLAADAIVPGDAVTRSGSGLDPHISPRNAELQTARVAKARNISADEIKRLIDDNTQSPGLGILGEPRVNVLMLNLALDAKHPLQAK